MPNLEVKARRVGGATYQVPIEVRPERRQTLGLRWLVNYAKTRNGNGMAGAVGINNTRKNHSRKYQKNPKREFYYYFYAFQKITLKYFALKYLF